MDNANFLLHGHETAVFPLVRPGTPASASARASHIQRTARSARTPTKTFVLTLAMAFAGFAALPNSVSAAAPATATPGEKNAERALLDAARYGNAAEVRRLLALGTNVDAKGNHAITPLMNAVTTGQDEVAVLLIEHGADVDAQDETGLTPLLRATLFGTTRAVRLLLGAGAEPDATDFSRHTALILAISRANYDVAHLLLDHGADIHSTGKDGSTPLMVATDMFVRRGAASLTGNRHHEVPTEDVRLVERLLDLGADVDARNDDGWTPLMVAAEAATGRVIQVLVERGADLSAKDRYGLRAFHWAYRANREDAILDLLALPEDFIGHQEPTRL